MDSIDDSPPPRPSPTARVVALAREFVGRIGTADPAAIAPTPAEDERLTRAGVAEPVARRFAVWRRAVLWVSVVPTAFAALLGLINAIALDEHQIEHLSNFGVFLLYLLALALFALPVTAVLAALAYDRLAASARLVLVGGAVSLGVPILVAFVPNGLLLNSKLSGGERAMKQVLIGLEFYLTLTPAVLSLLPAVSRGCVRVKGFLPQSLVPGWGLVASVPLFVLLTLATFVLLYRFVGNVLLVAGLVLWVGAPLLYLTRFRLLTCPVTDPRDLGALARTQAAVLGMIAGGAVLIVIYLFTAEFGETTIVGFDEKASLVRPWDLDLHSVWIEFIGRSLFLTVLFADIMVRMSLSVWREERAFAGTPAAAAFDATMSGLAAAAGPRG